MCAIQIEPTVRTGRLSLRKAQVSDAPRVAELANDLDVARMTTRIPHPYELSDAEDFLTRVREQDPREATTFAIEHPDDGVVGLLGFFANEDGRPELGYWLGRPYWGRGYATEAAEGALVWASETWGRRYVVAGHFADNPASGQVLCKAGFLYTGEVKLMPSLGRSQEAPARMMVWLA